MRAGEALDLDIVLADPNNPYGTGFLSGELLDGLEVALVDDVLRKRFGLEREIEGLVVVGVADNSRFADTFPLGAVLLEINGVSPESVDHARALLESRTTSRVYILNQGRVRYFAIRL